MWSILKLKLLGVLMVSVFLLVLFSLPAVGDGGYTISQSDMNELLQIISECKTNLQVAQDSLSATQKDLKTAQERVKTLETLLDEAKTKSDALTSQLQTQTTESEQLKTQLENAMKDLDELKKSFETLKSQIKWLKVQRILAFILGVSVGYAVHR